MTRFAVLALALAACDGGGSTPDAKMIDAATNTVVESGCPATPAATIMTMDGTEAFMPMTATITLNGIVKFTTSLEHSVVPNPLANPDAGLRVGFNMTKCLKFTATGTFGFMCDPHAFTGTITVN